jgi:hypothetical protein
MRDSLYKYMTISFLLYAFLFHYVCCLLHQFTEMLQKFAEM